MSVEEEVYLRRATRDDSPLLSNLLELYIHDLSPLFSVEPGPDGRFGYRKLPLYWVEPESRRAFLIQLGSRVAGFVLVTRGSPASANPDDLDIAEFFILRAHRRSGIGRRAAAMLWDTMPGKWVVRVSKGNQAALSFWMQAISKYSAGEFVRREGTGHLDGWQIFGFVSPHAAQV